MRILRAGTAALFIAAVPLFLLLTNVRIVATEERVYDYAFSRYDAPATTGIERSELDRAARAIIAYIRHPGDELLDIRVRDNGRQVELFTGREILHMADVRDLFQLVFRVHEIAFVYIVAYIAAVFLWNRDRSLLRLARDLRWAGALTVGLLGFAAVVVLVGFDTLFLQFHLLSFSNDFWQLDPNRHHLIQMFPRGFWFDVTLALGLVTLAEGALLMLAPRAFRGLGDVRRRRMRRRLATEPRRPLDE